MSPGGVELSAQHAFFIHAVSFPYHEILWHLWAPVFFRDAECIVKLLGKEMFSFASAGAPTLTLPQRLVHFPPTAAPPPPCRHWVSACKGFSLTMPWLRCQTFAKSGKTETVTKCRIRAPARLSTSGHRETLRPLQMILTHSSGLKICEFGWLPCRPR